MEDQGEYNAFYRHLNSERDGYGTVCVLQSKQHPGTTYVGFSLCGPLDRNRFNRALGRNIALGRAQRVVSKGGFVIARRMGNLIRTYGRGASCSPTGEYLDGQRLGLYNNLVKVVQSTNLFRTYVLKHFSVPKAAQTT